MIDAFLNIEDNNMRHPPYHLRINKSVDRLLLVDIMRALEITGQNVSYYSLAGPFLEDLRVMDHFFPEIKLFSLETSQETYKRQEFHRFNRRISLIHKPLNEFLSKEYEAGEIDVFWLDYTDWKYSTIEDFQYILRKVAPGSVIRLTVRAEPYLDASHLNKHGVSDDEIKRLKEELKKNFINEFDKVLPEPFDYDSLFKFSGIAKSIQNIIQHAASKALDFVGSKTDYMHIHSTRYNDHTQMLTITGVVYERNSENDIRKKLNKLHFFKPRQNGMWADPSEINVPALSIKERLLLESILPIPPDEDKGELLYKTLKYKIGDTDKNTKKQLAQYADYHRDYPNFVRMSS